VILIGSGLRRGRLSSRRWGTAWIAWWSAWAVVLLVDAVRRPQELNAHFFSWNFYGAPVLPWVLVLAPVWLVSLALMLASLYSAPVTDYIRRSEAYRRSWTEERVKALELRRHLPLGPPLAVATVVRVPIPAPPLTRGQIAAAARSLQHGKPVADDRVEAALARLQELYASGEVEEDVFREYRDLLRSAARPASA